MSELFDARSRDRLATCERDMQRLMRFSRAHADCPVWFGISWGHRTDAQQAELYAQGRTAPGRIVTYAKPGQSTHNQAPSPAADVYIRVGGVVSWDVELYKALAAHIKRCWALLVEAGRVTARRLVWGGDWRMFDGTHFELEPKPPEGEGETDADSIVAAGRGRRARGAGRGHGRGRRAARRARRRARAAGRDSGGGRHPG